MTETQSGFAEVHGTRLYYETSGTGRPVVFLHGFGLDARMWDAQVGAFAHGPNDEPRYRVVRYDLRGFGRSSLPGHEPFSHVDDLAGLLEPLGVETAHLVGLSLGGGIALDFALAHPEKVRALVLVDTTLGGYRWIKDWGEPHRAARSAGVEAARQAWLSDELFAPALEQPIVAARLRQMVADYSGFHWVNRTQERGPEVPAYDRLDQVRAPTLVVIGERDLPELHRVADRLAGRIPGARKAELAGAGHLSSMEAAAEFNRVVLDFLAQVPTNPIRP